MSAALPIAELDVPVAGGALHISRLGDHGPSVLAVHGITSSSRAWSAVARALGDRASLVAVDLRGRGRSSSLPPPYGLAAHVADLLAVLDRLELERVVVVGHSLGAYIAARLAAERPDRVENALLIDGGLTIPGFDPADPQAFLDDFLGPAIARLRMSFADRDAYRDWWRAHPALVPALASGQLDDRDLVAYADWDLVGQPPAMRSGTKEDAVRADGGELPGAGDSAHRMQVRATLLHAPRGLLDDPHPMQPQALVHSWVAGAPSLRTAIEVPDVNHYTITLGASGAAAVANQIASGCVHRSSG